MDKKRNAKEWHDAIIKIIKQHGGRANYDDFYSEIPKILQLNGRELRPSTPGANYEPVWRGTLRGYLTDMVQNGTLSKGGTGRKPIFSPNYARSLSIMT